MSQFLTFIAGLSLLMAFMYVTEKDLNHDRLKCIDMGGEYKRLSGEMHCVSKALFIDINGDSK